MRRVLLVFVCVSAVNGCASLGQHPLSPEQELRNSDLLAVSPPVGERYYVLVFGAEAWPKRPRTTHSWVTVVRVANCGTANSPLIEPHTISWMPAALEIRPLRFYVETGVNLDLCASIADVQRKGESISMWGPFETCHGFYKRFLVQKSFMESGAVGYQCIDTVGEAARCGNGCDCLHAIITMGRAYEITGRLIHPFGLDASYYFVEKLLTQGAVVDAPRTHDWLVTALRLDQCEICRRGYDGGVLTFSPETILSVER